MSKNVKNREEWISKIKIARKKQIITPEYKAKISASLKGKPKTAEHRKNIQSGAIKSHRTSEYREKMRVIATLKEKHWNWKGGITPLRNKIRASIQTRQWRERIFERDDFTCQECGKRGGSLEADHFPIAFVEILVFLKITSLEEAEACPLMWDIDNGRTLCRECHNKTKRRYATLKPRS